MFKEFSLLVVEIYTHYYITPFSFVITIEMEVDMVCHSPLELLELISVYLCDLFFPVRYVELLELISMCTGVICF